MKRDQYIPHEVSMRSTSEVMNLIEKEGMAGYGIYWALMEYLRTQDDYTGDVRILKTLARQLKTSVERLERILNEACICDILSLKEAFDYLYRTRKPNHEMVESRKKFLTDLFHIITDEKGNRIFTDKGQWYAIYKALTKHQGYPSNKREFCDIMINWGI